MEELCMGYYEDLYNNISNPLDDDAVKLRKIITTVEQHTIALRDQM